MELFALPVLNRTLVYAPLDNVLVLADDGVGRGELATTVAPLVGRPPPMRSTGPVAVPSLLGLIPTRGCTMACPYCDFAAPKRGSPVMTDELAQRAIDAYLGMVRRSGTGEAHLHFFGGEPFHAPRLVRFATGYAREQAARAGVGLHVEATSNGLYSPSLCEWVAHNLDAVVLSLDGPPDILDRHRPGPGGRSVADVLVRSARRLSDGPAELHLRACVTAETVGRLPEIAAWFAAEFRPVSVCFETIHAGATPLPGFTPPDPWDFAAALLAAEEVLAGAGIRAVMATAETGAVRSSFCPVGTDALIVSPDGAVDSCYLLEKDWRGLDLRLGRLADAGFELDSASVQRSRNLTVEDKPLCRDCFCRWHCAGGCHVNHRADAPPGAYDRLCVQTRIVTLHRLIRQAGEPDLAAAWLAARDENSVLQSDDRLHIGRRTDHQLHAVEPFAPTCLTLYLNRDCNLHCSYCFSSPVRHDRSRLTGEAVTAAARIVAANCASAGVPLTVALHGGGEPTLDPDLVDDLLGRVEAVASESGVPVFRYVATNGVMSRAKASWLAQRVDLVGLSCDGPPDLHDAQRPTWTGRPTSDAVERTARVLREAGTPFHVRATVTPESCTRQEEIAEYLCGLGAAEIHVEPVYRVGRAAAGQTLDPATFV
ncbi:MAG TPA: radical SAM protein, partial [Actinotalea sp.]|nr:radical SAM protein [Actinotalea sp.]